jgi:acyl transferase domain-containing protein
MNDDMQKTMQFILEQQAHFAVNLQKTEERVARLEENMTEMARAQAETARAQAETARAQTHMNEVVAVMVDTHKHTEEKMDAFIGVLERYISSNQNGGASKNGDA